MCDSVEVGELQSWLQEVVGEEGLQWEVTPDTLRILSTLRQHNITQESCAKVVKADLVRRKEEYLGEAKRIQGILSAAGVTDQALAGPASAYLEVLVESCGVLGEESCCCSGLELSLADQLLQQADHGPSLATARRQVDQMKGDTVELLNQLERVRTAVAEAEREDAHTDSAANQARKLEFMRAKEREYRANLERKEATLSKNGGGDTTLRHSHVVGLSAELSELQNKIQPAQREITGFLKLPPSCDLARVEVSRAEAELRSLTEAVNSRLATMHL